MSGTKGYLLLIFLILIISSQAIAVTAQLIGGSKGAQFNFTLSCPHDEALTGLYINYGSSAIGKIKGVCRKIGTDGKWFGQASHTDYSPQNINGSYSQNKIISCPKDWAVSGFKGKVYEYSTRHQIKAIKLKCRKLTSGGKLTGSSQDLSSVGPGGGVESSSISCSSDKPARKVIGHSKTYLQGFSLDCSQVPVQQTCTLVEAKKELVESFLFKSGVLSREDLERIKHKYPFAYAFAEELTVDETIRRYREQGYYCGWSNDRSMFIYFHDYRGIHFSRPKPECEHLCDEEYYK